MDGAVDGPWTVPWTEPWGKAGRRAQIPRSAWTARAQGFTIAAASRPSRRLPPRRPTAAQSITEKPPATMPNAGFVHLHVHSAYSLLKGSIKIQKLGGTGQGGPPAGAGADRHRQHVRGAGIFRQAGGLRHPADHRLRTGGRFRRPGSQRAQRAGGGADADRAAGGARARLPQPDAAELAGVPGNAGQPGPAYQVRLARGRRRRPDRADRRPGGADFAGDRGRSGRPCRDPLRPAGERCSATGSISNCSATASTRSAAPRPA